LVGRRTHAAMMRDHGRKRKTVQVYLRCANTVPNTIECVLFSLLIRPPASRVPDWQRRNRHPPGYRSSP
jgi:hypothetical protein